jgi:hypothetical protein
MSKKCQTIKKNYLIQSIKDSHGILYAIQQNLLELTKKRYSRKIVSDQIVYHKLGELVEDEKEQVVDVAQIKTINEMSKSKVWAVKEILKQKNLELNPNGNNITITVSGNDAKL